MKPFLPAASTTSLPPIGGRLGPEPRHFVVEEIPAYLPSGAGPHVYVWLEKTGHNTADVARALARAAGVRESDVGYAGMKDKNAVTRQWLSVPESPRAVDSWDLPPGVRILESSRHGNKLRTGHLHGNRFVLTLIDVPDGGMERATALIAFLREHGVPNYYGSQRFGREGNNLADALAWLADGASRGGGGRGRFAQKMWPSVIQAEIFNRYLAQRRSAPEALWAGEVVRLEGTGRHFVVEDAERELPRLLARDLHPTGALVGPKTLQAGGRARELEESIFGELGLDAERLERLGRVAPGARRDLLLHPAELRVSAPGPGELELAFELPAGGYATQVLRELLQN
ncbi:MAG TPA: tRNA pseudouridine(13) synthase TruD [Polyangiaceae bacterium]|nr:tRNA pseudouridine(13) synthase TruD [Polyangiaceae bacterium]